MCYWCEKKGHKQKDYKCQLAAKKRDKESKDGQAQKEEEASNVAIAKDKYNSSLYLPKRAMIVTSTAVQWTLDSRASKHFIGIKSNIQQVKQWNEPQTVRIANGVTVTAKGYSIVSPGQLQLSEVQYVLAFNNLQLLSIKSLTLDRHTIVFEGDTTTCLKHRNAIFKAYINQGTYIVEDGTAFFTNRRENNPLENDTLNRTFQLNESNAELQHHRLEHTNYQDIRKLEKALKGIKLSPIVKTVE